MNFEDKIPYIDKVANFVFGFILAYIIAGYFGWVTVLISISIAGGLKELWWDWNYDYKNVDIWDFIWLMIGAVVACIILQP